MSTDRKKILVFADWYEPGFRAGGPIRSCVNFAENMKDSHDLFIFTTDRDLGENQPYKDVEVDKWTKANGVSILYASPSYLTWKHIKRHVKSINPQYIYVNSMYSRYFSLYPLLIKSLDFPNSIFVLAPRGMLKKTAIQFKSTKKKIFIFWFKLLAFHKKVTFHATDITEEDDIKKLFGKNVKCVQIPNFSASSKSTIHNIYKQQDELKIISVGRIHPIKNLAFLLNCVKALQVKAILTVVGTVEDKEYWNTCEHLIKLLPGNITVALRNGVPNMEIENLIVDHHIFALPTKGENFGHAIFEALLAGRPVLISDQTPWRNLEQKKAGWDLPLNSPDAFVDVLKKIAEMDNDTFQLWCKGAWQLANNCIIKSDIKNQYLKLFK